MTLGLGRWQNLLRNAAGSEALENPRVQGLENFSATSPRRNASLLNRGLAGARGGGGWKVGSKRGEVGGRAEGPNP